MKVGIDKIRNIMNKYPNEFYCRYYYDMMVKGRKFHSENPVTLDDLDYLHKQGFLEIDIIYTVTVYEYLSHEYPIEFRKPYKMAEFMDIDKYLEALNRVNAQSKRKRCIYIIGDVYTQDSKSGNRQTVVGHNEMLDYKKWNEIKRDLSKDQKFLYRNSENGIIVFINMMPDAETSYMERFRKNTDLITSMVSRKKNINIEIAPDFISTEDVISVTDPEKLLDQYIVNNARLIIIGENISESYKKALLQVKQYDKFVRMMIVPLIDMTNLEHFLMQVKLFYNSNRWTE